MENFIYEGISFNTNWVKSVKEKDFIEHEKHHFENDPNGKEKLKEAYALMTQKDKPAIEEK